MQFKTFDQGQAPPLETDDIVIEILEVSRGQSRRESLGSLFSNHGLISSNKDEAPSLYYKQVSCTALSRHGAKQLLRCCSGCFLPDGLTAILGPSGAGKTTLLDIISQRAHIVRAAHLQLSGTVALGRYELNPPLFRRDCGYVPQRDALWSGLTVRDHFTYAFAFKYGHSHGSGTIIDEVVAVLGLESCKNTVIGGDFMKGCSGGQRRRTSVGTQIISCPHLMVLDEPTSGLDSFAALTLVHSLSYLSRRFHLTIGTTIHQPSTYVWNTFDQAIMLSNGCTAYVGKPAHLLAHLKSLGFVPMSSLVNPADYALELMSSDFNAHGTNNMPSADRVQRITDAWASRVVPQLHALHQSNDDIIDAKQLFQHALILLRRKFAIASSDPLLLKGRLLLCCYLGTVVGLMNMKIKYRQASFMDWLKVFSLETGLMIFGSVLIIPLFALDLSMLYVEMGNGMYSATADFLKNAVWDLINGLIISFGFVMPLHFITNQSADSYLTIQVAIWVGVCVFDGLSYSMCCALLDRHFLIAMGWTMVVLTTLWLANGFYIKVSVMPLWLRWLYWATPMRYMNDIVGMAMLQGVSWGPCEAQSPCYNGHSEKPYVTSASTGDILKTLSYRVAGYPDVVFHRTDKRRAWFVLVSMAVVLRLVGLYFVRKKLLP